MRPRFIPVKRPFDLDELPPHLARLDCYTLIGNDTVLIERKNQPLIILFWHAETNQFVSDCLETNCKYHQALRNGLWAVLRQQSPYESVLTYTDDWCPPQTHPLFAAPQQIATAGRIGR